MLVEESRLLEVSLFGLLQNNRSILDFGVVLIGVMTIADEIDSQLSQAMASFFAQSMGQDIPAAYAYDYHV
jgi:hypothetical protein